ncbi:MAG TPA: acetate--CoA ligase family protein [Nitrospirota bacterium]|nr:acetate--CoA ligase family protein [Nitrospirota bacterium]
MLETLFHPASIAVVGASNDQRKVGHSVLRNLCQFRFPGRLYPVNPAGGEILGHRAYAKIGDIGQPVDLAVIVIPAPFVPAALRECAAAGIRSAIVISAGFKEAGKEGTLLEEELKTIVREQGIRVLGPNCLGLINTANDMNATFAADMLPRGTIGFFSQSGAMGIAIMDWAIGNDVGFSKFVSLGNKADLSEIDIIEYFMDDPETTLILGYIEDVVDGGRFMDIAARATKVKPVILLKSGGTEAGARAASSHTGALAGSDTAFDAAFRQTGVVRAQGVQDLFDTALAFAEGKLPAGKGLLIVTNAGGPGIIAADAAERLGLELPHMTRESIIAMAKKLPPNATVFNPVDVIGDATSERYAAVLEQAARDPNVDGILVILTPQAMTDTEKTADAVIAAARSTDKPVIASFMGEKRVRPAIDKLKDASVPNFSYPELAVKAFRRLTDQWSWKHERPEELVSCWYNFDAAAETIAEVLKNGIYRVGEEEAMRILTYYGFQFPRRALARTSREAAQQASRIGFPVVMKVSSPDILHKTDVGGVRVNVRTPREAEEAFSDITANSRRLMRDAFIKGVMVYEMAKGGKEVILGVTYDRTFGHMIMFGLGGIYVEVLKDVSFRIVPVSRRDAAAMVSEIRTAGLLRGARGERPADLDAIATNIVNLSCLIRDFPEIQELDINPLMVMERGAVALDARIIFKQPEKK